MLSKKSLGYIEIQNILLEKALSDSGKKMLENLQFSNDFDEIEHNLSETDEMKNLLGIYPNFPSQDYFDLSEIINDCRNAFKIFELEKLSMLRISLKTIAQILVIIYDSDKKLFPNLNNLIENVSIPVEIFEILSKILDEKGDLKDNASEKLLEIRKKLISKGKELDKKIVFIVKYAKEQGFIAEDANYSIRNDSFVLPVQAVSKNKLRGVVHSISNTGQTFFIEPDEIRQIKNEIQELAGEEKVEILRILTTVTNEIRPFFDDLLKAYQFLGYIDFLRAKAKFALQINAVKPILNDFPIVELFNARHPILEISLKKQGKNIIPLDIRIDEDDRILVISGPNAGGKSVCLKTVGILQFMLQCGLLVPVDAHSEMGTFDNIFIDIGDQQSIENDLSTYSSHIKNMSDLLNNASGKTLFLCDELGSGTEPQIGGAIAEAIVEELVKKGSYGVITTHYANLKLLPDSIPHIVNAAMLFDTESHKPLYILQIGSPGSSFAMEMARNMGLPENILKNAEKKVGTKYLDFEVQLQQIEVEKKILAKREEEIAVADEFLKSVIEKYQKSNEKISKERDKILAEARNEAKKILSGTNKLIENTISGIKIANAEKVKTKEIRAKFEEEREKIAHLAHNQEPKNVSLPSILIDNDDDFETKLKKLKKRFSD